MTVYAGEKSAQTKAREALKLQLAKIKKVDGYFSDLEKIYDDFPANPEDIQERVAVVPVFGYEKTERFDNETLDILMLAFLLVYVKPTGSATEAIEGITADIQSVLGNNWMLPGEDGLPTCQCCWYFSAEPFGKVLDRPQAGVKIGVKILYQQYVSDPTKT
jgi:hypothetical protein